MNHQAMLDNARQYVVHHGAIHDDECPEDDTCSCSFRDVNEGIESLLRFATEAPASLAAVTAERDALAARCRELEGGIRLALDHSGQSVKHLAALLTPATPAAKAEEHPCSCGRPECKYDSHHGNGPYPAAKPETATGGGAA